MKQIFFIASIFIAFVSCEDVIDVELPAEEPRLAVDAVIRLDTSKTFSTATIKIKLSSSFFEENQIVDINEVKIQNLDYQPQNTFESNEMIFVETEPGIFEAEKNTSFFTKGELRLSINYDNEIYYASTRFVPSVPIDNLEQGDQTLFSGDETEVIVSFTDNGETNDFYILDFDFNEYLVTEDEFYQGQQFVFSYFYDSDLGLVADSYVHISILGADEAFYNYMSQVIVQSGGDQGPFQTPAATVRGNIFNITGIDSIEDFDTAESKDNFALGYFAVVQQYKDSLIIE